MAEDSGGGYVLGRLVLDYIKAFMWPAVAIIVVVLYQDDVRRILLERQVDIFGLRIGERVEQIGSQAAAEIEDIRTLLEAQRETGATGTGGEQLNQDIETKLSTLERNLSREISQVQTVQQQAVQQQTAPLPADVPQAVPVGGGREAHAAAAERRGFEALIAHDVAAAAAAFEEARTAFPDYHNVAELARALRKREDSLADAGDAAAWTELYREILTKYSWGLPADLRAAIRTEAAKAY